MYIFEPCLQLVVYVPVEACTLPAWLYTHMGLYMDLPVPCPTHRYYLRGVGWGGDPNR